MERACLLFLISPALCAHAAHIALSPNQGPLSPGASHPYTNAHVRPVLATPILDVCFMCPSLALWPILYMHSSLCLKTPHTHARHGSTHLLTHAPHPELLMCLYTPHTHAHHGFTHLMTYAPHPQLPMCSMRCSYNCPPPVPEDYAKEPPGMPPHLQLTLLNVPPAADAQTVLPRPQHVILSHLYCQRGQVRMHVLPLGSVHHMCTADVARRAHACTASGLSLPCV